MPSSQTSKRIIIAPLNWGWGHATRCIPIIKEIIQLGITPVIASDGEALEFLKKEFPKADFLELPSYKIRYGKNFNKAMLRNIPSIVSAIYKEHQVLTKYINHHKENIVGIISDNRLGIFSKHIDSVYITHQINIKAGMASFVVNLFHQYFIKKHKHCWIPDEEGSLFSGSLSKTKKLNIVYIGVLSRFKKQQTPITHQLVVLLSGIEHQRNELELKVLSLLNSIKTPVLVVRGTFNPNNHVYPKNVTVVNYLLSHELETALNSAQKVLVRSGYSSVMDMVCLQKDVWFVPTPGQTEQVYLAQHLKNSKYADYCEQKNLSKKNLLKLKTANWPVLKTKKQSIAYYIQNAFNLSLK